MVAYEAFSASNVVQIDIQQLPSTGTERDAGSSGSA
jgi:hypothetical protein